MNARRRPAESNVSLEPMRWWDVDGVMDLERDLFGDECWTVAMFWSELAEPETRFYLVARDGAEIVGYAGLCAYPEESFVQTIAVKRDRQGTGIGTRLLTALIDEARRRDEPMVGSRCAPTTRSRSACIKGSVSSKSVFARATTSRATPTRF